MDLVSRGSRRQDVPGKEGEGDVPGRAAIPALLPCGGDGGRRSHHVPENEQSRHDTSEGVAEISVGRGQDEAGKGCRRLPCGMYLSSFLSPFLKFELIYLNRDGTRKWTLYMITLRSFSSACVSLHIFYFRHLTLLKLLTPRGSSVAEPRKLWLRPFKCVSAIPVEIPLHHMVFGACHDLYHRGTELRLLCCAFSSPPR